METPTPEIGNPKPDPNNVEPNSSFLLHNGCNHPSINQISHIELISIQPVSYTSLKDLLPLSPPTITSPTRHNSSYHEIPIKNHLVKQAALAYLQPMCSPPEVGDKGLFARFKDALCYGGGECGCLFWLNDVVIKPFRDAFWLRRRPRRRDEIDEYDFDYDYEDDEDEEDDKVD